MPKYKLTRKATDDLSEIWNYTIDQWSEQQADKYYQLLIEACEEIASYPKLGKNYNEIAPNLRGVKASQHIIFYKQIDSDEVEIVRILHELMDLKNRIIEQ